MERVVSLFGLVVMMGLAWLLSSERRRMNLRVIAGGITLQFLLAVIVLRTEPGRRLGGSLAGFMTACVAGVLL